jgi:NADP-dependent 3-hydroxy acid dehydrogenase YdfG
MVLASSVVYVSFIPLTSLSQVPYWQWQAASGIGKAAALNFALSGCSALVVADINEAGAAATADACKQCATNLEFRVISSALDITKPESVQTVVDRAVQDYGRIDYFVNSAGVTHAVTDQPLAETDLAEWDRVMAVNARGTLLMSRAVTRAMIQQEPRSYESPLGGLRSLGRGAIVNIASVNGQIGMPGHTSYNGSKHAVIGMTKVAGLYSLFQSSSSLADCEFSHRQHRSWDTRECRVSGFRTNAHDGPCGRAATVLASAHRETLSARPCRAAWRDC